MTKAEKQTLKFPSLEVLFRNNSTSHREEEEYGSWEKRNDITYIGLTITDGYGEVIDFQPERGGTYYLVYVDYDTGDSFGREYGSHSIIGVYQYNKEAQEIADLIEDDVKNNPDSFESLEYKGRKCLYVGAWKGYFEHFNKVEVLPLPVLRNRN